MLYIHNKSVGCNQVNMTVAICVCCVCICLFVLCVHMYVCICVWQYVYLCVLIGMYICSFVPVCSCMHVNTTPTGVRVVTKYMHVNVFWEIDDIKNYKLHNLQAFKEHYKKLWVIEYCSKTLFLKKIVVNWKHSRMNRLCGENSH